MGSIGRERGREGSHVRTPEYAACCLLLGASPVTNRCSQSAALHTLTQTKSQQSGAHNCFNKNFVN